MAVMRIAESMNRRIVLLPLLLCAASASASPSANWQSLEVTINVGQFVTPAPPEPVTLTLSEAPAQLPFALALPAWIPDGFVLHDAVEAVLPADDWPYASVTLTWQNGDEATLTLDLTNAPAAASALSAGHAEAVMVNGQPATLTQFGLKSAPRGFELKWKRDGVSYALSADGSVGAEVLMQMAESVP